MQSSLTTSELADYVSRQLNHFFPDTKSVRLSDNRSALDTALDRLSFCFKHSSLQWYCDNGQPQFNHLHSDQYTVFLWYLANSVWQQEGPSPLANKLYYLNKALHAFDCLYNNNLPDIFLVFHAVGTVLGKAQYSDYLMVSQGCTVGANQGHYPIIGRGVGLASNSSIIGSCHIGNRASIGTGAMVFCTDMPSDTAVYRDRNGSLVFKTTSPCLAQKMFNVDLTILNTEA